MRVLPWAPWYLYRNRVFQWHKMGSISYTVNFSSSLHIFQDKSQFFLTCYFIESYSCSPFVGGFTCSNLCDCFLTSSQKYFNQIFTLCFKFIGDFLIYIYKHCFISSLKTSIHKFHILSRIIFFQQNSHRDLDMEVFNDYFYYWYCIVTVWSIKCKKKKEVFK